MSSPKAAARATAPNVAASLPALLSPTRAEASRKNGARSKGPKTAEGKARSAQNALKHGLRAQKFVVVGDEDPQAFAALEAALVEELAPEGALQRLLAARIARAAWRLERAERIEAELFEHDMGSDGDLGLALIRDGHGSRAFDTLLRYRGTAMAELWRALRTLKALQSEATPRHMREIAADPRPQPQSDAGVTSETLLREEPIEPEARANAGEMTSALRAGACARMHGVTQKCVTMRHSCATYAPPSADGAWVARPRTRPEKPKEPEARRNPGETGPDGSDNSGERDLRPRFGP